MQPWQAHTTGQNGDSRVLPWRAWKPASVHGPLDLKKKSLAFPAIHFLHGLMYACLICPAAAASQACLF